ncbi:hypothetical protein ElyMa_001593300 [Elysia marginata]|uniref:Uncharacterized protein n=1 Tax=Elysia marginata TaxID=1093978 RepID=A0AAV4JI28_9GAST|nr:hypothetical protein ElyMa_001593300 [Elysia marginata]
MAPLRISFLIRSVYDLLPSNATTMSWKTKYRTWPELMQSGTFTRTIYLQAQQGAQGTCLSNKHCKRTVQPTFAKLHNIYNRGRGLKMVWEVEHGKYPKKKTAGRLQ